MKREIIVLTLLALIIGFLFYDSMREAPSRMPVLYREPVKADSMPFDREEIRKFELLRDDTIVVAEKRKRGTFKIKSPIYGSVDKKVLGGVFDLFENIKIKKTIRQDGEELPVLLSEYGLDKPHIVWKFFNNSNREKTLLVGKKSKENDGFFVKWIDRSDILLLPSADYPRIDIDLKALRSKVVLRLHAEDLVRIRFKQFRFEKKGQKWYMTTPVTIVCDQKKMARFIRSIKNIEAEDFIKRELKIEKLYRKRGQENELTLMEMDKNGKKSRYNILFGKPVEGNLENTYIFIGKDGYIVKNELFERFGRSVTDFVDARLISYNKQDVNTLSIGNNEHSFTLQKVNDTWQVSGDLKVELKTELISKLVEHLTANSITDFVHYSENVAHDDGLVPVQFMVKVNNAITLAFGKIIDNAVYFLRDDYHNCIGKTKEDIMEYLSSDIAYYRTKQIFHVKDHGKVASFSITRKGKKVDAEKIDGQWYVVSPLKGKITQGVVDDLLDLFKELSVQGFVAENETVDYGFDVPLLTVTINHDGVKENLIVSALYDDQSYYGMMEQKGEILLIDADQVNRANKNLLKSVYVIEADSNNDGTMDTWTYFDNGKKTRMELDITDDGIPDSISNYIYDGQGEIQKIETDDNNDGTPDQITYYVAGNIVTEENDTDRNGSMDSWTYFKNGQQDKLEIDVSGNGIADMTKVYSVDSNGQIIGADVDQDNDGVVDYKEIYRDGKIIKQDIVHEPSQTESLPEEE